MRSRNLYEWKAFKGMLLNAIKNYQGVSYCIVLELVPLRSKNLFGSRSQERILVPLQHF